MSIEERASWACKDGDCQTSRRSGRFPPVTECGPCASSLKIGMCSENEQMEVAAGAQNVVKMLFTRSFLCYIERPYTSAVAIASVCVFGAWRGSACARTANKSALGAQEKKRGGEKGVVGAGLVWRFFCSFF